MPYFDRYNEGDRDWRLLKELQSLTCDQAYCVQLIEEGVVPLDGNWRFDPMPHAVHRGFLTVVKALIASGMDVDHRSFNNRTPLITAAHAGHTDMVRYLLEAGATIDARDFDQSTPLMWAVGWGGRDTVRLLLNAGADIYAEDRDRTPLQRMTNDPVILDMLKKEDIKRRSAVFRDAAEKGTAKKRKIMRLKRGHRL
ncbi:MAG: ankyrin repeat domain-containing protein [Alphaproteobacteria bacterium]|nr:ankyrin repeat domain-containing protein [Alphaproteobacteria bacterium]